MTKVRKKNQEFERSTEEIEHNIKTLKTIRSKGIERLNSNLSNNVDLINGNPIIEESAKMFDDLQQKYTKTLDQCKVCMESSYDIAVKKRVRVCNRCYEDKKKYQIPKFSKENKMHPGEVPECLLKLTDIEETAIKMATPLMHFYCRRGIICSTTDPSLIITKCCVVYCTTHVEYTSHCLVKICTILLKQV